MALAGRLLVNFALTIPLLPWARITLPQITRVLLGLPPGVTVFLTHARTHTHTLVHAKHKKKNMNECECLSVTLPVPLCKQLTKPRLL